MTYLGAVAAWGEDAKGLTDKEEILRRWLKFAPCVEGKEEVKLAELFIEDMEARVFPHDASV